MGSVIVKALQCLMVGSMPFPHLEFVRQWHCMLQLEGATSEAHLAIQHPTFNIQHSTFNIQGLSYARHVRSRNTPLSRWICLFTTKMPTNTNVKSLGPCKEQCARIKGWFLGRMACCDETTLEQTGTLVQWHAVMRPPLSTWISRSLLLQKYHK